MSVKLQSRLGILLTKGLERLRIARVFNGSIHTQKGSVGLPCPQLA